MTRFVYVLPAGRFRWEVRVDDADFIEDVAEALYRHTFKDMRGWNYADPPENWLQQARAVLQVVLPAPKRLFYRRKAHALIAARAVAILIGGEVQPHDRRGVIQDPDSYGPDSPRRRG